MDWNVFLSYDSARKSWPEKQTQAWWETVALVAAMIAVGCTLAAVSTYASNPLMQLDF
jgi:hypothetical protein